MVVRLSLRGPAWNSVAMAGGHITTEGVPNGVVQDRRLVTKKLNFPEEDDDENSDEKAAGPRVSPSPRTCWSS